LEGKALGQGSLRDVVDAVSSAIVLFDLADRSDVSSLRIVHANPAAKVIVGIDIAALAGRPAAEALPYADPGRLRVYGEICQSRVGHDFGVVAGVSGNGRGVGLSYRLKAVPVGEASVAAIFDVVEPRPAESSLNQFLSAVIEHLPTMVFVKDADELRFEYFNKAGEELLGLSRGALLGKNDHDLFPKEQADFFVEKDRQVLGRYTVEDIPEEPIETERGRRWLHTRKIPIADAMGRPRHLLGVSIDITEQKLATDKLHDQLRQAQKMEAIGRLAGGVAHDFNNLLSVIMGHVSLAIEGVFEDDPLRAQLDEVLGASLRARDLTRQLLAFSRQQVLEPRIVDLNRVIGSLERMLERLIGEDVEFVAIKAPDLGHVLVDPSQLEQVVMNLVVNARDAMPRGGKLTIQTANVELDETYASEHENVAAGPHVMLAVIDTGHGMDRATQARIFEPFFTTKEVGRGTGLGLSTVFGIVRQSGGHVYVYSEPEKGAAFKVYFPRVTGGEPTTPTPQRAVMSRVSTETILVLEDEDHVRRVVVAMLQRGGYEVIEATRAEEALDVASDPARPIDLLLTDIVMPGMSGPEVVRKIRELRPGLKAICMSGYTDETVVRHGILESGIAFLQKPVTPDSLRQKVHAEVVSLCGMERGCHSGRPALAALR
jgi:two-component system cell cycle sensor histidine kinase/response regulator CckA